MWEPRQGRFLYVEPVHWLIARSPLANARWLGAATRKKQTRNYWKSAQRNSCWHRSPKRDLKLCNCLKQNHSVICGGILRFGSLEKKEINPKSGATWSAVCGKPHEAERRRCPTSALTQIYSPVCAIVCGRKTRLGVGGVKRWRPRETQRKRIIQSLEMETGCCAPVAWAALWPVCADLQLPRVVCGNPQWCPRDSAGGVACLQFFRRESWLREKHAA